MWCNQPAIMLVLTLASFGAFATDAGAIELSRKGETIHVLGTIKIGDAKEFRAYLEREYKPHRDPDEIGGSWTVSFDSPGGSLADGIDIGRALHENGMVSLVRKGEACYSACAIAFLGGVFQYATGIGPKRQLEVGAKLGFHGYHSEGSEVVILNEAFDQARALNGLVLEYAAQMKEVDLGFLASLLNVPAAEMRVINTPSALKKLNISIETALPARPKTAGYNVCAQAVRKLLPALDGYEFDERLARKVILIPDTKQLLRQMVSDLYLTDTDDDAVQMRTLLAKLPIKDAIDLMTGRHIVLDYVKWPVERFALSRGSGFYYDQCYVLFEPQGDRALSIVAGASTSWVYTSHAALDFYPPDEPLWK